MSSDTKPQVMDYSDNAAITNAHEAFSRLVLAADERGNARDALIEAQKREAALCKEIASMRLHGHAAAVSHAQITEMANAHQAAQDAFARLGHAELLWRQALRDNY